MAKMGYNEPALATEYVGVQKGWATVGDKTYHFRSQYEVRWAQYLELLKMAGEIIDWEYEPRKFEFEDIRSGTVFYTPDFKVCHNDVVDEKDWSKKIPHIWHECKGHLTQKDITKFRRMAKYYPDERIILVMQNIPKTVTKRNRTKILRLQKAEKYVERIMDGTELLRKAGL
jgi:hypothetical protein